MTVEPQIPQLSRRVVLRLTLAGAAAVATGGAARIGPAHTSGHGSVAAATGSSVHADSSSGAPDIPRYVFHCMTAKGPVGPFTRIEGLWADPQYLRILTATAVYNGLGSYQLTAKENAIVDVAVKAGASGANPTALYLRILSLCTRVALPDLQRRLAKEGAPVVTAAIALYPDAPQAGLLGKWLAAHS